MFLTGLVLHHVANAGLKPVAILSRHPPECWRSRGESLTMLSEALGTEMFWNSIDLF